MRPKIVPSNSPSLGHATTVESGRENAGWCNAQLMTSSEAVHQRRLLHYATCNLPHHIWPLQKRRRRRIDALRHRCVAVASAVSDLFFLVHETKTTFCVPAYPISPYLLPLSPPPTPPACPVTGAKNAPYAIAINDATWTTRETLPAAANIGQMWSKSAQQTKLDLWITSAPQRQSADNGQWTEDSAGQPQHHQPHAATVRLKFPSLCFQIWVKYIFIYLPCLLIMRVQRVCETREGG